MKQDDVHLLVWSGDTEAPRKIVAARFSTATVSLLSKRTLRERGWRGQLQTFRKLRGRALVFFFNSPEDIHVQKLLMWSGIVHGCDRTIIADAEGKWETYGLVGLLKHIPSGIVDAVADAVVFSASWLGLRLALWRGVQPVPIDNGRNGELDLAYLFPFPMDRTAFGGSLSHVCGFLEGLAEDGATCDMFSARALPVQVFPTQIIASQRKRFLFWESVVLSYNVAFARSVIRLLNGRRPLALYQRHRRFTVAGALLSMWLHVPLILEYNSSERWTADHWDPSRFRTWLGLCEDLSLASASLIVVVSEPLRQQLIDSGVDPGRILVNPNGVDTTQFRPHPEVRRIQRSALGLTPEDIAVCFVGTFSYWHGIPVLQQAIAELADSGRARNLRFVLVGDGPLSHDMRTALKKYISDGTVIFTGSMPHDAVVSHLDASDILVSPHLPMPDGRPFFGSPTKLFEYMAMGKAIVASNLDQLALVLRHNHSAWLVTPGNPNELAEAIALLASDSHLRERLGANARASAVAEHTWQHNAARVLERLRREGLFEVRQAAS